jgi:hypothetical protein
MVHTFPTHTRDAEKLAQSLGEEVANEIMKYYVPKAKGAMFLDIRNLYFTPKFYKLAAVYGCEFLRASALGIIPYTVVYNESADCFVAIHHDSYIKVGML